MSAVVAVYGWGAPQMIWPWAAVPIKAMAQIERVATAAACEVGDAFIRKIREFE